MTAGRGLENAGSEGADPYLESVLLNLCAGPHLLTVIRMASNTPGDLNSVG